IRDRNGESGHENSRAREAGSKGHGKAPTKLRIRVPVSAGTSVTSLVAEAPVAAIYLIARFVEQAGVSGSACLHGPPRGTTVLAVGWGWWSAGRCCAHRKGRGHMFAWADLVAGLSIAGLLLPEAVAYSGIAGLPPQAGVAALLAGLACYGLV